MSRRRIAIAGAGNVAQYFCDELINENRHDFVVLSREPRDWFVQRGIDIRITDYSVSSLTSLLQDVDVLFSFIHDNSSFYNETHLAMIEACKRSPRCKRFVPSECGGDIEKFPDQPLFYVPTHGAIRSVLREQSEIEYTLFNLGWFMDYFVPAKNSWMKRLNPVWPLDLDAKTLRIPGTGNEPISFTAARDVAKALVKLIEAPKWEEFIFVVGDTLTWNEVVKLVEQEKGIKLQVTYRPLEDILRDKDTHAEDKDPKDLWFDYMDMWNALGASAIPHEKALRQRNQYFQVRFRTVREYMKEAEGTDRII